MRQTGRYLKKKIRKFRQLYKIIRSLCRHRRTYLKGVAYLGKSMKGRWRL